MEEDYNNLRQALHTELHAILNYWQNNTVDGLHGGFVGKRDFYNNLIPKASKGIILNTRILWAFSAASNYLKSDTYTSICKRSYDYLQTKFRDKVNKGVFWELDYVGQPVNSRKQAYAQAFAIYALSEYYTFSKNEDAKHWAIELFECLELHARDKKHLGYLEAFNEDWTEIKDMRLSDKDMNAAKTMNTHLHVLEAYTSLLKIYDHHPLKDALKLLIELFHQKFLNCEHHYDLFFDENWTLLSDSVSYGHDIEAAWLVMDAAELVGDEKLLTHAKNIALKVADTFIAEAVDSDGGVFNEKNRTTAHIDTDKHWWPQVEALVGLDYAYALTQDPKYAKCALQIWDFTKNNLIDHDHGEWHFRVDKEGNNYSQEDKVSMWKAPYHTTRACIKLNTNI
ncbi:AGE family epimerase/isomerase [Gelidibacter mesophilus]|uniref:AGE family epimerase/isomerase n=1 Tax=Gelidibacter mesophilus TaxID=169050 RepID=UPI0004165ABB|nr:AGE family epimerase/isomerase [Gelidibacter mesophilus]